MTELIDLTNGLEVDHTPQHYIEFGAFNSQDFQLHLAERDAPTPEEKENVRSIPLRQGVVDMSNTKGCRVYENRTVTYTFYRIGITKDQANTIQTTVENLLMREFNQVLQDSYDPL